MKTLRTRNWWGAEWFEVGYREFNGALDPLNLW